jgi:cytochrome P450
MTRDVPGLLHRRVLARRRLRWLLLSIKFRRRVRVLEDPNGTFSVPYGAPSADLGIGGFVLSLEGVAHKAERERMIGVLSNSVTQHREGLEVVRAMANVSIRREKSLDVMKYASEMAGHWTVEFFGLNWAAKPLLAEAASAIVTTTFENPTFPGCPYDRSSAQKCEDQVNKLRLVLERQLADDALPGGTVFWELVHGPMAQRNRAVADVIGLIGGPVELVKQSAQVVVHWALASPSNWALLSSCANRSEHAFAQELEPIFSMFPIAGMVPRLDEHRRPVMIALWDSRVGTVPRVAPDLNPVFGFAPHKCLGKDHALEALAVMLLPIFKREGAKFVDKNSWTIRFTD